MFWSWLSTILILPFNALVIIPALLLWICGFVYTAPPTAQAAAGWALFPLGFALAVWTCGLFHTVGKGTAAPWNPPKRFVVRGPYRFVRNPMIISVLMMLTAEAALLNSRVVAIWTLAFWAANQFYYFPKIEEPKLRERFGEDYAEYTRQVRRWIPKLRGYDKQ